jgi:ribosome-binding factor A
MKRTPRHRPERLAALIQETIAAALTTDVKDPRVGFVTVTSVTVSSDGSHATVRVAVMGSDEEKASAMEGLRSAKGFLRSRIARTLRIRTTPELHIVLDRGLEHAARIAELLDEVGHDEPAP